MARARLTSNYSAEAVCGGEGHRRITEAAVRPPQPPARAKTPAPKRGRYLTRDGVVIGAATALANIRWAQQLTKLA